MYNNERILVVSDSHGRLQHLQEAIDRVQPDRVLHLGDIEGDEEWLLAKADCPVILVRGNCDYSSDAPMQDVVEIGGHRAFLAHGHTYGVGFGLEDFAYAAKEAGCDVAIYGHTHVPLKTETCGVTVLNPGSISLPRQDRRIPTFVVINVDRDGGLHFKLNEMK